MKIPKNSVYNTQKILKPNRVFIPLVDITKDYYISKRGKNIRPSVTEKIIATILKKHNIKFLKEVSFRDFGFDYSPYRFDFYLPDYQCVIEYDGQHHSKTAMKINDKLKNQFCRLNNIKIYRFNKKHYERLDYHIIQLLKKLTK